MSRIPGMTGPINPTRNKSNDLRDLDVGQFMDLMIAELQNQDPLDPMDNSEMLQQMSQIRSIGATSQLTETLNSVLLGQNLGTASGLIGKQVTALSDDGKNVEGEVERVSVLVRDQGGQDIRSLRVHIGDQSVDLKNVREITN